jgi:hypothetical protein
MNIDRVALEAGTFLLITNENGDEEEWRKISTLVPHFDDKQLSPTTVRYASSAGRLMRFTGEILDSSAICVIEGYQVIGLSYHTQYVHVIICYTFHGPPPRPNDPDKEYYSVDHKNRIRSDNRASNLQWATWKEQYDNRSANGVMMKPARVKKDYRKRIKYSKPRYQIAFETYLASDDATVDNVATQLGIAPSTVRVYIVKALKENLGSINQIMQKLNITPEVVYLATTVMRATQISREVDKKPAADYTETIVESLGVCSDSTLAISCLSIMYQHLFSA